MSDIVTLIPAYKKDYLAELFLGLHTQSFRGFEVVLSDDSPNGEVSALIRSGAFDRLLSNFKLVVVQGPRLGSLKNIQHLLDGWGQTAPLVHIHLDDDVIYPGFYRAHLQAHLLHQPGASVSQRWPTGPDARPSAQFPLPESIESSPLRIVPVPCAELFASTVPMCQNWLGELSNIVLSAEGARRYRHSRMDGMSYYGLGDVGVLLDVSRHAPIAFVRDHLSGFRSNPQQASAQTGSFGIRCGHLAWFALALAAWNDNRINTHQAQCALAMMVQRCEQQYPGDLQIGRFMALIHRHAPNLEVLHARFGQAWADFLATDSDSREPGQARSAVIDTRVPVAA